MCAGTVVEPPGDTSAAMASITSRSRSVALRLSLERSALISTLARIGIVLRRSTTRWTWPSDLSSSARSTVTFISTPARSGKVTCRRRFCKSGDAAFTRSPGPAQNKTAPCGAVSRLGGSAWLLFLQLPLEDFDLLGERHVVADQALDLSHGVEDRGVVAAAEPPADLRQRAQGQCLGEIHRHLARPHHIGGAARGQEVGAAHVVLPRDDPLNVLDL